MERQERQCILMERLERQRLLLEKWRPIRVHQGTSRQGGGANSGNFKNSGGGINSSDLMDNF
jgi:hypothetical protein